MTKARRPRIRPLSSLTPTATTPLTPDRMPAKGRRRTVGDTTTVCAGSTSARSATPGPRSLTGISTTRLELSAIDRDLRGGRPTPRQPRAPASRGRDRLGRPEDPQPGQGEVDEDGLRPEFARGSGGRRCRYGRQRSTLDVELDGLAH